MALTTRRRLLITGAAGGMGRACARLLGLTHDLILTDVAAPALDAFAGELRTEGYTVLAAPAGDLADAALLTALTGQLAGEAPFALVHAAGLSPAMADWRRIMASNLVATEALLRAIEPVLVPGSVVVVIASAAGYVPIAHPEVTALLADPLAPGFFDAVAAPIEQMAGGAAVAASGLGYVFSKQAVLALVERRGVAWGPRGARIASISPGMILTAMGRKELAETPGAAELAQATPIGRMGNATDIAMAARFLLSDEAAFITGSDLKVDGGGIAATRLMTAG